MNKWILIFMLLAVPAMAQLEAIKEPIVLEPVEYGIQVIDTTDVTKVSTESMETLEKYIAGEPINAKQLIVTKPGIESEKLLADGTEKTLVKAYIKGKTHIEALPAKNDYVDEFNRGTVYFNTEKGNPFNPEALKMRNYSFHKVIIPDGTTIKGVNFTQKEPHTVAITGKNLTFIECNLKNVEIDVTWTLIDCLSIHAREREEKGFKIYEVEKDGIFVEVSREEIISDDINIIK